jgi:taurine dioxygenase
VQVSISVTPLSEAIGAEIIGVDLSLPVSVDDLQIIHTAIEQNLVVVLRDQRFDPQSLLSAVQLFGETMEQHLTDTLMDEHPEIALLDSREMPPDSEGKIISFGGRNWHTDHTNHEIPPKFTALYAIKLTATGGDTSFANMHLAYDSLDEDEQIALSKLQTVNKIEDFAYIDEKARETFGKMPIHPLIRTHPTTHKKAIYVHPGKLEKLVGMAAQDSHILIRDLLDKVITRKISYRHKWQKGDLLLADNRAVLHLAHQDYDLSEGRIMHRILIKGERPI